MEGRPPELFPSAPRFPVSPERQAFAFLDQLFELDHEFADILKERYTEAKRTVGDRIGIVELAHQRFANHRTGDFLFAPLLQSALDAISNRLDAVLMLTGRFSHARLRPLTVFTRW